MKKTILYISKLLSTLPVSHNLSRSAFEEEESVSPEVIAAGGQHCSVDLEALLVDRQHNVK